MLENTVHTYVSLSLSVFRRHQSSWGSSADILTDPHSDPTPLGHEALPAVPSGDPPSSTQHEPLPQLQYGKSCCRQQAQTLQPFKSSTPARKTQNCKCCAGCWRLPPLCFNLHSSLRTVLNAIVSFKICWKQDYFQSRKIVAI